MGWRAGGCWQHCEPACPQVHVPSPMPVSALAGRPHAQPRTRSCGRKSRSWRSTMGEHGVETVVETVPG